MSLVQYIYLVQNPVVEYRSDKKCKKSYVFNQITAAVTTK